MGFNHTGSVDTTGGLAAQLLVPRPQTAREWRAWYAQQHAAHVGLINRGNGDLLEVYGLDADAIADQVRRWDGPRLPGAVFTQLFGRCPYEDAAVVEPARDRAAKPDPAPAVPPTKARRDDTDGYVDEILVEQALAGQAKASDLNTAERIAVAGRMFDRGSGITAISRLLHMSGHETAKLIGLYQRAVGPAMEGRAA